MNPIKKLCALAMLMLAGAFNVATAADFEVDGISYNVIGDGQVEVTSPESGQYAGEVFIPSTVVNEGTTYQVTRVGYRAFYTCRQLTLVDIPDGVTSIGESAFSYCSNLQNVELPNSLVSIDTYGFYGCSSFTYFHIPRNLAVLGEQALTRCTRIRYFSCSSLSQHFKVVDGVLYSKDMTHLYFYPLAAPETTFDVPSPVERIHEYCFYGNQTLTQVNFPETLRWIDMNIFRDCKGIQTAYIPDGVTHMGMTVFGGCSNLTSVHLPASLDSILNSTFMMCEKLTEVTIPRNVKYIGPNVFGLAGTKTVTFEEGSCLETIDHDAFFECYTLENINLPNSVKTIEYQAFYKCESLQWFHIGEGLTTLGTAVFSYTPLLVEGYIPGTVTCIWNAFIACPGMKRLKIGSKDSTPGVTLIKNGGFDCPNLEYLELGANVDSLENNALVELDNLKVFICWAPTPPKCGEHGGGISGPQYLDAILYVPKASLEAYRTAPDWKEFKTIVPIEDVGDANGDGSIDIADITDLIDQILSGEILNPALADVDLDGSVSISDVAELIDWILNND